jgi:hypothetical protein
VCPQVAWAALCSGGSSSLPACAFARPAVAPQLRLSSSASGCGLCRLKAEQQAKAVEVELLEQASAREQQLLAAVAELSSQCAVWRTAMHELLASFHPALQAAVDAHTGTQLPMQLLARIAAAANKRWLGREDKARPPVRHAELPTCPRGT